jgi:UTP-glucose-1-phosphate uridylyltransferase
VLCYCDDIFFDGNPTAELLADYQRHKLPAVLGCAVPIQTAHNYGVIMPNGDIIEKPQKPKCNIAAVGRYLLTPEIFKIIKSENCMSAALNKLNPKRSVITNAVRFDTGKKDGFYMAFKYIMDNY